MKVKIKADSKNAVKVKKSPLPQEAYRGNAHIYRVLAHPKRLEILNILKMEQTSVEDLLKITGMSKANLSQHLALLRYNGLIEPHKKGLRVSYSIVDTRIVDPCAILHSLRKQNKVL